MDDNSIGLLEKARLADEYGFNILAEGYQAFSAGHFHGHLQEIIDKGQARGVVVVLDTLKKFVDLMHKTQTSSLTRTIRAFVLKGGTLIALAHTNKNPGRDGKPMYGGVSDILNDFDCAYVLIPIASEGGSTEKIVEFENIKHRGNVVQSVAYGYSLEPGIAYSDLVLSVRPVEESQLVPLKQAEQSRSDAELIGAVTDRIKAGYITKMKLTVAAAERAGVSRKIAGRIIEKYTGDDPVAHRWKFTVQGRGAKVFVLLDPSSPGTK